MTQDELYVIIGKQAAVIENYQHLLEAIELGFLQGENQVKEIKRAVELAQEILK